jgi:hypothetical protein
MNYTVWYLLNITETLSMDMQTKLGMSRAELYQKREAKHKTHSYCQLSTDKKIITMKEYVYCKYLRNVQGARLTYSKIKIVSAVIAQWYSAG